MAYSSPYTLQGFRGDVARCSCVHIVDFSPGMSHTRGFRYSASSLQRPVTTVSIGLKHPL